MANVFVYGTLLIPDIAELVAGIEQAGVEAKLHGYARFEATCRRCGNPPTIIPDSNSTVQGKLYTNVTDSQLDRLDWFEDIDAGLYIREYVEVEPARGDACDAWVYTCGPALLGRILEWNGAVVLSKPWSVTDFIKYDLEDYLKLVRRWMDTDEFREVLGE